MKTALRPELEPLPPRMRHLPIDARGYVVPYFVAWIDGRPEFRVIDPKTFARCLTRRLCWVCGDTLGQYLSFCLGPMCTITRTTAEPASHHSCASWSARNCPFLTRPHMVRREDDLTAICISSGDAIKRNPGVVAIWTTKQYRIFTDDKGGPLLSVGDPSRPVDWYAEGRTATRAEVEASIASGLPLLRAAAQQDGAEGHAALDHAIAAALQYLPVAEALLVTHN